MVNAKECNFVPVKKTNVAFVILLAMFLFFASACFSQHVWGASGQAMVSDSVIVVYKEGVTTSQIRSQLVGRDSAGSTVSRMSDDTKYAVAEVPAGESVEATIDGYEKSSLVQYAQPNYLYRTMSYGGADTYFGKLWYFANIGVQAASVDYGSAAATSRVTVAVLDTGVNAGHSDLTNLNKSLSTATDSDSEGHGTHVTGILSATADNNTGVSGVASAITGNNIEVIVRNVFAYYYDDYGNSVYGSSTEDIIKGIKYALANNARVINLSLGYVADSRSEACDPLLAAELDLCETKGVTVVSAGGNDGENGYAEYPNYPADYKTCISVTATGAGNKHASYSNHNSYKDLAAPGTQIYSTMGSGYGYDSGTSMAAPVVSGVAASMYAVNSSITPAQVREALYETASDLGTTGWDQYYGYGLVNADRALLAAERISSSATAVATFSANGGYSLSFSKKTLTAGKPLSTLPTVRRKGYAFSGWYDAASAGRRVKTSSLIVNDRKYYAHWSVVSVPKETIKTLYSKYSRIYAYAGSVSGAAGYQLKYSKHSSFSDSTYKTSSRTRLVTGKLKKGSYYYVKVRAYKLDSAGARVYGSWSSARKIRIR
jgi:uncharacterized repeat protein (TIGR02543 family)